MKEVVTCQKAIEDASQTENISFVAITFWRKKFGGNKARCTTFLCYKAFIIKNGKTEIRYSNFIVARPLD